MGAAGAQSLPHRMGHSSGRGPTTDLFIFEPSRRERETATMLGFGERGGLLPTPSRHYEKPESATVERFDTVAGS